MRLGMNQEYGKGAQVYANAKIWRVFVDMDSRAVVMEVEIRLRMCNNLPAESASP